MKGSWLLALVLRFGLLYAVLVFVSLQLPLFAWVEAGAVELVDASLRSSGGGGHGRSLSLLQREDDWYYRFEFRLGEGEENVERRYHPHAYVLLLFVSLVLGTPGLTVRRRLLSLGVGGLLVFALGVGLLMSDVQSWEQAAAVESGADGSGGAFRLPLGWLAALHRTSGAALIPLLLWLLFAAGPAVARRSDGDPPAGSPRQMAAS